MGGLAFNLTHGSIPIECYMLCHNNAKEAKKIALKSMRKSLAETLPWSLEDHLLDNILGHLNLLEEEEEANESWRLEIAEEDKPGLSSLYLHLSQIYSQIRTNLFIDFFAVPDPELIDQLQEILAELKREETTEEIEQEDEGGEIMGGNQVEVEDGGNDEVEEEDKGEDRGEDKGENQLEKSFDAIATP